MTNRPIAETIPVAPLKVLALNNCTELGEKINDLIVEARHTHVDKNSLSYLGYESDRYLVDFSCPRFGSGEGKAVINQSVRGSDLYILADVINHSIHYKVRGKINSMSPDDNYQDLKRVIAACSGQTHRINVIMPFLYEGRQHRRDKLESLDCALALQELVEMGVDNIITFDAHDPRVQNAIPIQGFDNFYTTFQFIRSLIETQPDLCINNDNLMIISPDEGGMSRSVYYANVLGVDMGMFYKRRDYSTIINGKNPIVAHEFLGNDVSGKDVFIVDDMIASGESVLEVAKELKKRRARKIFIASTYGLFTEGLEKFDRYYEHNIIDQVFTTNLTYCSPELMEKPYYTNVDLSKYIALIIDTLNNDTSVNEILNPTLKIQELLANRKKRR